MCYEQRPCNIISLIYGLYIYGCEGVERLMLVHSVKHETLSVLSVGSRASRDLAVWDVQQARLQFSLDVGHSLDFTVISTVHKAVICGDADSGAITAVSLTGGSVEHTSVAAEYRGMTDMAVCDDSVFVATPSSDVMILSVSRGDVTGHLRDPGRPSVPTKLLASGRRAGQLVVGYQHGLVVIFDVVTQTVIRSLPGHSARINSLHLLATGQLISAADDRRAIIWNDQDPDDVAMETGMWAESAVRGDSGVKFDACCYTLDGSQRLVYAGVSGGDVQVWDAETG